jgi:ligand-binding SRPBCC domain-containing protein
VRQSILERTQWVDRPLEAAFAFFGNPQNLAAITPPWLGFRILAAPGRLDRGALIKYRLRIKGVPISWVTEITAWQPPRTFTDAQREGPYRRWVHTHRLTPRAGGTEFYDHVGYVTPGGALADRLLVRPLLDEIFDYRALRLGELLG